MTSGLRLLDRPRRLEHLVDRRRLPVLGQAGRGEDLLVEEDHPAVGALRDAVELAVEAGVGLHGVVDLRPTVPAPRTPAPTTSASGAMYSARANSPTQRPVDREHVRPLAGSEVEGELRLVVLVVDALPFERDRHRRARRLHLRLEGGDDLLLEPDRGVLVLAPADRVVEQRQLHRLGAALRRGGERRRAGGEQRDGAGGDGDSERGRSLHWQYFLSPPGTRRCAREVFARHLMERRATAQTSARERFLRSGTSTPQRRMPASMRSLSRSSTATRA